jgi:uncharacterized LabA/DUF88 family protein
MQKQRVIAYIDGFNVFYSCVKGTPYKWLDLVKLCESYLLPNQELVAVKYFSALVNSFKTDPGKTNRQKLYIQALQANPLVEIELGFFSIHKMTMPRADDFFNNEKITPVEVVKTEEKGTDVNLAVQIVADAKDDKFDYAMLFSNDSDMSKAVRIATKDCKKKVGLYIARGAKSFNALRENVVYIKYIKPAALADCQLPKAITLKDGSVIKKPKDW